MQQVVEKCVDAGNGRELYFGQGFYEPGHVARVGNENVLAADLAEYKAVGGQRTHVVERQGGNDDLLTQTHLATQPGRSLLHVCLHRAGRYYGDRGKS